MKPLLCIAPLLAARLLAGSAAHAATLTVAPGGRAGAPGTEAQPLAGVQEALNRAQPGDTVHLKPGIYRERVAFMRGGTYTKPVTLEGDPGAVIDGSEALALDWQPAPDVAPGVYRARVPFPVFTLTADGKIVTMLREDRVRPGAGKAPAWEWPTIFRDGVGPSGWEGVKALALYLPAKKEVLLRFQGDRDPRAVPITVAPREACVRISGADRCVVRGLTLRNAAYGVFIEYSLGSVVEKCTLGPVDFGVWLDSGSDRCTVRFNEIFMNPYAGADPHAKGAWDNWQAHKTGGHYDRYGVQIHATDGGHEVHDNDIHDTWDGIEDRGEPGQNRGLRIHHNRIFNISDDGLEPNGAEEDCRWHDNVVQRCICGFRIKAPTAGPMYAYRNLFLENSEDFRNYGEVELKPAVVYVYHNTCTASAAVVSNKVHGIGTPNYHYFNNLFRCRFWWWNTGASVPPNWKGDGNVYARRDPDPRWDEGRALAAQRKLDANSLWTEADPFTDFAAHDLTLRADSPARARGADLSRLFGQPLPGCEPGYFAGKAPDAGAIPFGQAMPRLPRRPAEVNAPAAGTWPPAEAQSVETGAAAVALANGGFEAGVEGWGKVGAPFQVKTGDALEGTRYLAVQTGAGAELHRPLPALAPGKRYTLTYWSRRSTSADARIIVRDIASSGYLANGAAATGSSWQRSVLRFTAPAGDVRLEISLRAPGGCELDGFTLARAR